MDKLIIKGMNPLRGEVSVSGAKNAVLPILAASVMPRSNVKISNIPHLHDVTTTIDLLGRMGVGIMMDEEMNIHLDPAKIEKFFAPYDLVKTMRSSILVLGPLLTRFGEAKVSLPGGCAIGTRPVNMHIKALREMGANIEISDGYIIAKCKKLKGANIRFPESSVTGTENIIMAACLADGKTEIINAAKEPEVTDLSNFLVKMGAKISGQGTNKIEIEGVSELEGTNYSVLPDRIETGTFLVAGAITGGKIKIKSNTNIATIIGVKKLYGADCISSDLRTTFSIILGAIAAVGESRISRVYHGERGYYNLVNKLKKLGINIKSIS